jgi:hypothetical protein
MVVVVNPITIRSRPRRSVLVFGTNFIIKWMLNKTRLLLYISLLLCPLNIELEKTSEAFFDYYPLAMMDIL